MSADFETTVRRLWTALRLPPPSFGAKPAVTLTVDGIALSLAESDDGLGLDVTGRPGRLSNDPAERDRQTERVLKIALGLLASNRAGIGLDRADPSAGAVLVQYRHPYRDGAADRLVAGVEDVLRGVEILTPELAGRGGRAAAVERPSSEAAYDESIIFRP